MAKFVFRLQKVMDYRELLEGFAKDAFLEARANRIIAEAELEGVGLRRTKILQGSAETLQDRIAIEQMMIRLEDEERQQRMVIDILTTEEEAKRDEWVLKRQEFESLVKLYDKDLEAWNQDENRKEQAASDEWALHRRTG